MTAEPAPGGWVSLSRCGRYRYALGRRWGVGPEALFVMLNPSTADAARDDPTIRRCIGFARREGCGGLRVVNLFAWRATVPTAMTRAAKAGEDIVGARNAWALGAAPDACDGPVIAGWGGYAAAPPRAVLLARQATRRGRVLECLGLTRDGHPRHPLYLRNDAPLAEYRVPSGR